MEPSDVTMVLVLGSILLSWVDVYALAASVSGVLWLGITAAFMAMGM